MMGLKNLTKRDARWLKILLSQGKFTVDAIKTIKGNVSLVVKGAIDDSDDDDDYEEVEVEVEVEEEEEEGGMVMLLGVMIMVKMTKDD